MVAGGRRGWRGRLVAAALAAGCLGGLGGGDLASLGCGGAARGKAVEVPIRTATAAEALLPLLPEGAQVVIELDLDRARGNAVLGPLVRALLDQQAAPGQAAARPDGGSPLGALQATPLAAAHAVVVASYRVGSADAASLTLVKSGGDLAGQARELGAVAIGQDVLALGPAELIEGARVRAEAQGQAPAASAAPAALAELLALRARPMPAAATGALLRVTAELSFEARLSLARQTSLDPPPARLALWVDAVDDAALILLADSAEAGEAAEPAARGVAAARLGAALRGAIGELARDPRVVALGLGPSLRAAQLERAGSWVKVAVIVGPQRLQRAVQRAAMWVAARAAVSSIIPPAAVMAPVAPTTAAPAAPPAAAPAVSSPTVSTVPSAPEPP